MVIYNSLYQFFSIWVLEVVTICIYGGIQFFKSFFSKSADKMDFRESDMMVIFYGLINR